MTDKRKFWWPELSKWDDHVVNEWIQWIELVAGASWRMRRWDFALLLL